MKNYISKILYILGEQRKQLILIVFSFALVSCVEALSIGLIGPFVSVAMEPTSINQSDILSWMYIQLNFSNERLFIASLGIFITIIFCLKSLIVWRVKTNVYSYSSRQQVLLRERLMNAYLNAPYTFHLSKNSAHIINNILSETFKFTYRVLNPLLELISNFLILIFIIALLAITSWITLAAALVIFLPLLLSFNYFKVAIAKWGKESSEANQQIVRAINHGLGGIKETTIIGCGSHFQEQLVKEAEKFSRSQRLYYAFNVTPRIMIEAVVVIFIVGFTSVSLFFSSDISELTALLSVFAVASMRLIPAATQIANGLSSLKNSSFTANKLYSDLKELATVENRTLASSPTPNNSPLYFDRDIELKNICYSYPQSSNPSLVNLSLKIEKGSSIAFIGKSGAGKTTLVDLILGLLIPESGDMLVDNCSAYENLRAWQNKIGYIPQSIFLIEDTIASNIAFGVPEHLIDAVKLNKAVEAAQLTNFVRELPQGLNTIVGERGNRLSGGQRQRVGIARALYHEREILVLDEATAALDDETEILITESIAALSQTKTIIMIAHRLTTVRHCDRIYVVDRGKIVKSGSYDEVVLKQAKLR